MERKFGPNIIGYPFLSPLLLMIMLGPVPQGQKCLYVVMFKLAKEPVLSFRLVVFLFYIPRLKIKMNKP
jgi:hypothetical protein